VDFFFIEKSFHQKEVIKRIMAREKNLDEEQAWIY